MRVNLDVAVITEDARVVGCLKSTSQKNVAVDRTVWCVTTNPGPGSRLDTASRVVSVLEEINRAQPGSQKIEDMRPHINENAATCKCLIESRAVERPVPDRLTDLK